MGLYLGIATIFSIMTILFFNNFFDKVFNNYYAMSILGIVFFIYFWVIRYQEDVMNLINGTSLINGEYNSSLDNNTTNIKISKVFLLDLCPFVAILFSILLTFDRQRNVLKIIAPYAFFGGAITIFGQIMWEGVGTANNNFYTVTNGWDFIFGNEAYFLMHYFTLVTSLIIIMNSKGFGLSSFIYVVIFPLSYFAYIMIFVTQFGVTRNATGLVQGDWVGGQYQMVWEIFGKLSFPYIVVLCYSLVAIYIFSTLLLRNIFIFDNKWKHPKMIVFPRISISIRSFFNKVNKLILSI